MAFRVSPGVSVTEKDLTAIVPAVATTPGGFAGYFHWGPCNEPIDVTSESELVRIFGKPKTDNYVDFFTAANYLGYGNLMKVVRVVGATAYNSTVTHTGATGVDSTQQIPNETSFFSDANTVTTLPTAGVVFASKFPGVLGNSIKCVLTNGTGTQTGITLGAQAVMGATTLIMNNPIGGGEGANSFSVGDDIVFEDGTTVTLSGVSAAGEQTAVFSDFMGVVENTGLITLITSSLPVLQAAGNTFSIKSVYAKRISTTATTTAAATDAGGSNDLVNILVLDKDGKWTGSANSVLEKYEGLSRATDAVNSDGSTNYWKSVINTKSAYVWALAANIIDDTTGVVSEAHSGITGSAVRTTGGSLLHGNVLTLGLTGASDATPSDAIRYSNGWTKLADADALDIGLLPLGNASATLATLVIQNVCETRKDCIAFVSPASTDVVNTLPYAALNNLKTFRDTTLNVNSSYAVADSGWKYQLDTYNNVVRTMPLNPDIAGLVARTEFTNDAWFSPAGFNRGQIKNVVKLAYNPSAEAHRDELYTRQINPVVSFPGEGTILFGDKTMATRPSAFDRINVRRLFIILEKSIATASKFFLFEQNDEFTRAQFRNMIIPFLKTIVARRGITDFLVICDESNNTSDIIDRNEFVASIFVKPTRTVNFIQLNFVATSTGVAFSEVVGA